MKSLLERHADRAQRKADNLAETGDDVLANNVGTALTAMGVFYDAVGSLTPAGREKFEELARDGFGSMPDPTTTGLEMAGIGVVNPLVVPAGAAEEAAQQAASRGNLPAPNFDPEKGNINGAAVEAAGTPKGGGWGNGGGSNSDGYTALSFTELKKVMDDRKLAYDAKAKDTQEVKDGWIAQIRADDKKDK